MHENELCALVEMSSPVVQVKKRCRLQAEGRREMQKENMNCNRMKLDAKVRT